MRRQDVKKKGKWICCVFILASFPMSIRAKGLLGLVEPGVSSPRGHITQSARPSGFGVESLALFVCVCVGGGVWSPLHSRLLSSPWAWCLVCFLSQS